MNCSNLKSISFAHGLKAIESHAFSGIGISELVIPEGVERIELSAFSPCMDLKSVRFPSSLKVLGEFAFSGCRRLTDIEFPEGLEEICRSAFSMCLMLKNVTLPKRLKKLVRGVFLGCSNLKEIGIGPALSAVENNAFSGCRSLRRANVSPDNPFFRDIDGVLFSRDCKTLVYFPGGLLEIGIPDGVTEIGAEAFYENNNFDKIVLPPSLKKIGRAAFYRCTELSEIEFPEGLKSIGAQAFEGCSRLRSLYLPDSISEVRESAFRNSKNIMWIRTPSALEFDLHWFCAPNDPPCYSADHTVIPFVPTREFADIASSIGLKKAAIGFVMAENFGVKVEAYLAASFTSCIKNNISDFYDSLLSDDDMMRWAVNRRVIPQDDVERLIERAGESGRAGISAMLLGYKNTSAPRIEAAPKTDIDDRFSALENALDF